MAAQTTRWWNKRLPIRHRRRFLLVAYIALLLTQGISTRRRLLSEGDWHYQIAFLCYSLVMAAMFVAAPHFSDPDRHMEESEFVNISVRNAAFYTALMTAFWLFNDYGTKSMNAGSLVGTTVFAGFIFTTTLAATKNPSASIRERRETTDAIRDTQERSV